METTKEMLEYADKFFRIAITFPSLHVKLFYTIFVLLSKNGQPFRHLTFLYV